MPPRSKLETGRKRRIQRKKMGFGESETEELA
jgi:hypothetical protein